MERTCDLPISVKVTFAPGTAAPLTSSTAPDTLADPSSEADGALGMGMLSTLFGPGGDDVAEADGPLSEFCARNETAVIDSPKSRKHVKSCSK